MLTSRHSAWTRVCGAPLFHGAGEGCGEGWAGLRSGVCGAWVGGQDSIDSFSCLVSCVGMLVTVLAEERSGRRADWLDAIAGRFQRSCELGLPRRQHSTSWPTTHTGPRLLSDSRDGRFGSQCLFFLQEQHTCPADFLSMLQWLLQHHIRISKGDKIEDRLLRRLLGEYLAPSCLQTDTITCLPHSHHAPSRHAIDAEPLHPVLSTLHSHLMHSRVVTRARSLR